MIGCNTAATLSAGESSDDKHAISMFIHILSTVPRFFPVLSCNKGKHYSWSKDLARPLGGNKQIKKKVLGRWDCVSLRENKGEETWIERSENKPRITNELMCSSVATLNRQKQWFHQLTLRTDKFSLTRIEKKKNYKHKTARDWRWKKPPIFQFLGNKSSTDTQ